MKVKKKWKSRKKWSQEKVPLKKMFVWKVSMAIFKLFIFRLNLFWAKFELNDMCRMYESYITGSETYIWNSLRFLRILLKQSSCKRLTGEICDHHSGKKTRFLFTIEFKRSLAPKLFKKWLFRNWAAPTV